MRETLQRLRERSHSGVRILLVAWLVVMLVVTPIAGVGPTILSPVGTATASTTTEWTFHNPDGNSFRSVAYAPDADYVFGGGDDGNVYVIDDSDGSHLDTLDTGTTQNIKGMEYDPERSVLYVHYNSGLQAWYTNGTQKWDYDHGGFGEAVAIDPDTGVVYTADNSPQEIIALSPNGSEKWTVSKQTRTYGLTFDTTNDHLHATQNSPPTVQKLSPSDGSVVWEEEFDASGDAGAVTSLNGYVYPAASTGRVSKINPSGSVVWNKESNQDYEGADSAGPTNQLGFAGVETSLGLKTDKTESFNVSVGEGQGIRFNDDESNLKFYHVDSLEGAILKEDTGESLPISVSGTVTNPSGDPIDNAAVSISNSTGTIWTGTTDANGNYESMDLADGEYTVTVDADGYAAGSQSVTISGSSVTVDFTLTAFDPSLSLETRDLFQPGNTHGFTVRETRNENGRNVSYDVTSNATVESLNTSLLTVNEQNNTLTAPGDANVSGTVTVRATHNNSTVQKEVVVAEPTVENLELLPTGTWRSAAVMGDGFFQALLVALFVGVAATRFTSAFAGLAGSQMTLVIGWFAGYVPWVYAVLGLFVALFIGLNLAANIDYTVRR